MGPDRHRTRLATRIMLLTVGIALLVALTAGVVGTALIRSTAADATRGLLTRQVELIKAQLTDDDTGLRIGWTKFTDVLAQQGVSVVMVGRTGTLSGPDASAIRAADLAGARRLPAAGTISAVERVAGRNLVVEGRSAGERGFVLVAPTDLGAAQVRSLQARVWWALLIGLAAAVIGALVLARVIARPLRRTAQVAREMGAGARQRRVPPAGPAEVADVAVAVNELADALARSESRQREFLASVSHELRTPLTAIAGQGQALADHMVTPAEMAQVGSVITAESARLGRLVNDLLDLARLGAEDFRLELAPCDLSAVLRDAHAVWQTRCTARGVRCVLEVPDSPVVVVTDARRIRQVVDGLADNALRLLPAGAPLVFALSAVGRQAVLQIRDGGPGLEPQDYPVAFEPGVLHRKYRDHRPGGAGLGLALVSGLVTRLGGQIQAGPAPECGLAVTIRLPAQSAVPAPACGRVEFEFADEKHGPG